MTQPKEPQKVNDQFTVAGQVTPEDLNQAAQKGFKSVLNLRSPHENNALADEQQHAEAAGLTYANVPLSSTQPDPDGTTAALEQLQALPGPVLIHCGAGLRASAIALIATATQEQWSLAKLTEEASRLGFSLEQPQIKQFIQDQFG